MLVIPDERVSPRGALAPARELGGGRLWMHETLRGLECVTDSHSLSAWLKHLRGP